MQSSTIKWSKKASCFDSDYGALLFRRLLHGTWENRGGHAPLVAWESSTGNVTFDSLGESAHLLDLDFHAAQAFVRFLVALLGVPQVLADFLGHNANAVQWQIWMGLLVHLLLRYLAYLHVWGHSFTRLFTVLRAVMWRSWHLGDLLNGYGTAKPPGRLCGHPEQAFLPGFA